MTIYLADKTDKKAIKRFYKQQNYSASFMGDDSCFYHQKNQQIVAALIISFQQTSPFLHALVVAKGNQGQGLAKQLITHVQQQVSAISCFCQPQLISFYQQQGFVIIQAEQLPTSLQPLFNAYQQQQQNLSCLHWQSSPV